MKSGGAATKSFYLSILRRAAGTANGSDEKQPRICSSGRAVGCGHSIGRCPCVGGVCAQRSQEYRSGVGATAGTEAGPFGAGDRVVSGNERSGYGGRKLIGIEIGRAHV